MSCNFGIYFEPEGVEAPHPALTSTVGSAPCSAIRISIRILGHLASGIFRAARHVQAWMALMSTLQYTGDCKSKCFLCEEEFVISSERSLFCSNLCKKRYDRAHRSTCFYCGDMADTREHLLPHSISGRNRRIWALDWVSACRECNSYMGSNSPFSLTDRVRRIIQKVTKKYRLNDPNPDWDESDLEEMSDMFRRQIIAEAAIRRLAEGRIVMLKARLFDLTEQELSKVDNADTRKNIQTPSQRANSQPVTQSEARA
jgi:hypothetical protein